MARSIDIHWRAAEAAAPKGCEITLSGRPGGYTASAGVGGSVWMAESDRDPAVALMSLTKRLRAAAKDR